VGWRQRALDVDRARGAPLADSAQLVEALVAASRPS
jgi:hypothetical protein